MSASTDSASALLRHKPFLYYFAGRGFSNFSRQIVAVAIGWQVYQLTGSAFALGMVGLVQFLPTAFLTFYAGHAADRFDRKRVVQICQFVESAAVAFLAWGSYAGWLRVEHIFIVSALFGVAVSFERPAAASMLPAVVPPSMLQRGTALNGAAMELASICGPALGGFASAVSPGLPYLLTAVFWLVACVFNGAIQQDRPARPIEAPTPGALYAGVGFVRRNPTILGTISLDLFAVLLGGATALLPIYASDILHTGPWGLGVLRAAPAVGSLLMTLALSRWPISRRVGLRMFQAVIVFGAATVLFALSTEIWLSLLALLVMGASDTVSVVIRMSLVQLATPDEMRGRVSAVNSVFIGASNQLGEFESGASAAWLGPVASVVLGGIGTLLVAAWWVRAFPALARRDRLDRP